MNEKKSSKELSSAVKAALEKVVTSITQNYIEAFFEVHDAAGKSPESLHVGAMIGNAVVELTIETRYFDDPKDTYELVEEIKMKAAKTEIQAAVNKATFYKEE